MWQTKSTPDLKNVRIWNYIGQYSSFNIVINSYKCQCYSIKYVFIIISRAIVNIISAMSGCLILVISHGVPLFNKGCNQVNNIQIKKENNVI